MPTPKSNQYDLSALDSISGDNNSQAMAPLVSDSDVGITKEAQPFTGGARMLLKTLGNIPSSFINGTTGAINAVGSAAGEAYDTGSKLFSDEGRKELLSRATSALSKQITPDPADLLGPGGRLLFNTVRGMAHKYSVVPQTQDDPRTAPIYKQITEDPLGTGMDVLSVKTLLSSGAKAAVGDVIDATKALKNITPSSYLERQVLKALDANNPGGFRLNLKDTPSLSKIDLIKTNPDLSVSEVGGVPHYLQVEAEQPGAVARATKIDQTTEKLAQKLLDKSGPLKVAYNEDPQAVSGILRQKIKDAISTLPEDSFAPVLVPGVPATKAIPPINKTVVTQASPPTSALKGSALKEAQVQQQIDLTRKIVPQQDLSSNTITPGATPASQPGYVDPTQPYQPIKFGQKEVVPGVPATPAIPPVFGAPVTPRTDAVKWLKGGMKALADDSDVDLVHDITKNSTTFQGTFDRTGIDPALAPQLLTRKALYAANTTGSFDASKFISTINQDRELWNSPVIKELPDAAETKAGLNQFAYRLEALAKRPAELKEQSALQIGDMKAGMDIAIGGGLHELSGSRMGLITAARGFAKKFLNISDKALAKLTTNKDANWILSKLADTNQTNPALPSLTQKLVRVMGTMNIPITLKNADGTTSQVGQ